MTKKKDLKVLVRERQAKTGESYMVAKRAVLARGDEGLKPPERATLLDETKYFVGADGLTRREDGTVVQKYDRVELGCDTLYGECVLPKGHRSDEHGDDHQKADGTWWNVGTMFDASNAKSIAAAEDARILEELKSRAHYPSLLVNVGDVPPDKAEPLIAEVKQRFEEKLRGQQTYLVWETEYPDEGSFEIEATSEEDAKAQYRKDTGSDNELELGATLLTPEIAAQRQQEELRGRTKYVAHLDDANLLDTFPADLDALKYLRFNPSPTGDNSNFFGKGYERLSCGHLVMNPDSQQMKDSAEDLLAFHGLDAVKELRDAAAHERLQHTSGECLKPGWADRQRAEDSAGKELLEGLMAKKALEPSVKIENETELVQLRGFEQPVPKALAEWADKAREEARRELAETLKALPMQTAVEAGPQSVLDEKTFEMVKLEKLPCGHSVRKSSEVPQDLKALWGQAGVEGFERVFQEQRQKHLEGRCSEATDTFKLVPKRDFWTNQITMALADDAGRILWPTDRKFVDAEIGPSIFTIDVEAAVRSGELTAVEGKRVLERRRAKGVLPPGEVAVAFAAQVEELSGEPTTPAKFDDALGFAEIAVTKQTPAPLHPNFVPRIKLDTDPIRNALVGADVQHLRLKAEALSKQADLLEEAEKARLKAMKVCKRCGEEPRPEDPGLSNGACCYCDYWNIPVGPAREAHRAERRAPTRYNAVQGDREPVVALVNGKPCQLPRRATYADVLKEAGYDPERIISVTYRGKRDKKPWEMEQGWRKEGESVSMETNWVRVEGILSPGQTVEVCPGLVFNAVATGNA